MKRQITMILSTVALLCVLAFSVSAAPSTDPAELNKVNEKAVQMTEDNVFAAGGTITGVVCPYCNEEATWKALPAASAEISAKGLTISAGHYYVAADLTSNTIHYYVSGNVCIHLNGKNITSTHDGAAFSAPTGAQLNMMGNGSVSGKGTVNSLGVMHIGGGTLRLFGGIYSRTATNPNTVRVGAANSVFEMYTGATVKGAASGYSAIHNGYSTAVLNMYGGTVDANAGVAVTLNAGQFHQYGGTIKNARRSGVIIDGGAYTLHDGEITKGNAMISGYTTGGNVLLKSGSFTMEDGEISNGLAYTSGGNVYVTAGTFTMKGGEIRGGSAYADNADRIGGGGVYIAGGTFDMQGGKVFSNAATGVNGGNFYLAGGELKLNTGTPTVQNGMATNGGNIYVKAGTVTLETGSVTQNSTEITSGGNVYMEGGQLKLNGTAKLSGGTATYGGVLYIKGSSSFVMTGGSMEGGNATYGGNLCVSGGTAKVQGGTITGGTAAEHGGNVYAAGGTFTLENGTITQGTANSTQAYHRYYYYGGGNIYVGSSGKCLISGGTVSDGVSTYRSGGNILCYNGGTLTISGGTICGGQSAYPGGNIMNGASKNVTISGGTITGGEGDVNSYKLADGDNIVSFGGVLTVSGGTVESNGTCAGDGIWACYNAKLILDGDARITNSSKKGNILIDKDDLAATLEVKNTFTGVAGVAFHEAHGAAPGKALPLNSSTGEFSGTLYAEDLDSAGIFGTQDNTLAVAGIRVDDAWYPSSDAAVSDYNGGVITLYTSDAIALAGGDYTLDLAGQNVTVTGTGTVTCFDSANDTFKTFGSLTLNGPTLNNQFVEVFDGNKSYFKLEEDGSYTFHRANYQLTSVSLRPSNGGIYFTGKWEADDVLKAHIDGFGVAVNLNKVPGSDFSEQDGSMWTRFENSEFVSGTNRNGVLITDIIRTDADADRISKNAEYGKKKIHATAYITVDGVNYAGSSMSYSLYDVLAYIAVNINDYSSYSETLLAFMDKWDDYGLTAENGYNFDFNVADSIKNLNALYAGLAPYYGELHDHADTGGTSDGRYTLAQWKESLPKLEMDFATILDHKQTSHMYLEDWDDTMLLGASEGHIRFADRTDVKVDYNMIFADPKPLEEVLASFPELKWQYYPEDYTGTDAEKLAGGWHYSYPTNSSQERFREIVKALQDAGGFVVIPHPKSSGYIQSNDPADAYYGEFTGIEVFYTYQQNANNAKSSSKTKANYKLWTDMLAAGYKVYATAGNDDHNVPSNKAVSVVYAYQRNAQSYLDSLRSGHFVAGGIGIKMAIGDTMMGGVCDFAGKELAFSVGDFHSTHLINGHEYEILLIDDQGTVDSWTITSEEAAKTQYYTYTAEETAEFYRVEIFDKTTGVRIVIGNPIWND